MINIIEEFLVLYLKYWVYMLVVVVCILIVVDVFLSCFFLCWWYYLRGRVMSWVGGDFYCFECCVVELRICLV